jgi:hypothetical protein
MTTDTAPDIAATLARLEEDFAAHPTDVVGQRIVDLRSAITLLESLAAKLEQLSTWHRDAVSLRTTCCVELFDLPSPIRSAHDRARYRSIELSIRCLDSGLAVLVETGAALEGLRLGALMRESGYAQNIAPPVGEVTLRLPVGEVTLRLPWYGSIPEVERKIADLTARKIDAQHRLDAALRDSG